METTVFLSNRSQAVRLPKAVALPEDVKKVEIIAIGRTRIITHIFAIKPTVPGLTGGSDDSCTTNRNNFYFLNVFWQSDRFR